MGANTDATGVSATAVGDNANALARNNAVAIGGDPNPANGALANANRAIAIGFNSEFTAADATAVGSSAQATDIQSAAYGSFSNASGPGATAVGNFSEASKSNAVAVGNFAKALNTGATAVGDGANATGPSSSAFGQQAFATNTNALAVGFQASASGVSALAVGDNATASADAATAIGLNAQATGVNAIAIGTGAVATGSIAVGSGALASNGGAAFGDFSTATGSNSTAVGPHATATHANSAAFGTGATTTAAGEMVFGRSGEVGAGGNTYTMGGVTSDDSKARQSGPLQLVTTDQFGHLASDGGAVFEAIARAQAGIAIAIAMEAPSLTAQENFGIRMGYGNFDGDANAIGTSAMGVICRNCFNPGSGDRIALDIGLGLGWSDFQGYDSQRSAPRAPASSGPGSNAPRSGFGGSLRLPLSFWSWRCAALARSDLLPGWDRRGTVPVRQ